MDIPVRYEDDVIVVLFDCRHNANDRAVIVLLASVALLCVVVLLKRRNRFGLLETGNAVQVKPSVSIIRFLGGVDNRC